MFHFILINSKSLVDISIAPLLDLLKTASQDESSVNEQDNQRG